MKRIWLRFELDSEQLSFSWIAGNLQKDIAQLGATIVKDEDGRFKLDNTFRVEVLVEKDDTETEVDVRNLASLVGFSFISTEPVETPVS